MPATDPGRFVAVVAAALLIGWLTPVPAYGQTDFSTRLSISGELGRLDAEARRIENRLSVLGRVPGIAPDGGTSARIRLLQRQLGQINADRRMLRRSDGLPGISPALPTRPAFEPSASPRVTLMPPADPSWHPAEAALLGSGDASQRAADYVNALLRANAARQSEAQ